MFTNYPNFLETCTDKQVLACAYAIKEDQEEGNLTRAIQTFGRTLVNLAMFSNSKEFYDFDINTYDYRNNNIDCVGCVGCKWCFMCENCKDCERCFRCVGCKWCFGCLVCRKCKDCYNSRKCYRSRGCNECSRCNKC